MARLGRSYPVRRVFHAPRPIPPVVYDATGAGQATDAGTTLSWSHNAQPGAYVLVFAGGHDANTVTGVTYGGAAMTLLGSIPLSGSSSFGSVAMYGKAAVPGTGTVSVSFTGISSARGSSVSYRNVGSVSSPDTEAGTFGNSFSHAITGMKDGMIVQAFRADGGTTVTATGGGTSRYSESGSGRTLIIQDSASTSSVNFTATLDFNAHWAGIGVLLRPRT